MHNWAWRSLSMPARKEAGGEFNCNVQSIFRGCSHQKGPHCIIEKYTFKVLFHKMFPLRWGERKKKICIGQTFLQLLLRLSWYCQGVQQIRPRSEQVHQAVHRCKCRHQKELRHWGRLWAISGSRNFLPSRVRKPRFHHSDFRDCGWSCPKLSHWCSTRPVQQRRPLGRLHHVQRFWAPPRKRFEEECGCPTEGNRTTEWRKAKGLFKYFTNS